MEISKRIHPSLSTKTLFSSSSFSLSSSSFWASLLLCIFSIRVSSSEAFNVTTLRFDESYVPLFSDFNIDRSSDEKTVRLLLNRKSGSGIISADYYNYGFFSASIKMPADYSAGIVVAFYTSNVDTFEKNHDELDIEFLGNVKGKPWRFQTNMYGNGSVSRGREERYRLWFDPSKESHNYSIFGPHTISYEVPIREIKHKESMGGDYPSKPMSMYATIWDASSWATNGGKEKTDYKYEPFAAEFKDLVLEGCIVDPIEQISSTNCTDSIAKLIAQEYATITPQRHLAMKKFRERYMYYSYCYDNLRYPVPPPECVIVQSERDLFKTSGRLREKMKFGGSHRKHRRGGGGRRQQNKAAAALSASGSASELQAAM